MLIGLKGCPRCSGPTFEYSDYYGDYAQCLDCSRFEYEPRSPELMLEIEMKVKGAGKYVSRGGTFHLHFDFQHQFR